MSNIALYTLCDDNYTEVVCSMLYSFLINNAWFDGDIVILCDDGTRCNLSEGSRDWIRRLYKNIVFEEIDPTKYDKLVSNAIQFCRDKKYGMLYYKLEVFRKNGYERKVFLDGDTIVNKNIWELFHNNENRVMVVEDELKLFTGYFNSGVMSIPMSSIADDFYDELITAGETLDADFFKNKFSSLGDCYDQDILNELIKNKALIGREYNTTPNCYDVDKDNIDRVKIIHYYGGSKPWQWGNWANPAYILYYKYWYMFVHGFKI